MEEQRKPAAVVEATTAKKGGAASAAPSKRRTTSDMLVGSGRKVDTTDYSKTNPKWKKGRLDHIERRTTAYLRTAKSNLKPPHNPAWKKGRLDHIKRPLTIPLEAPPKWVITDKSFEGAGLKLVAWKWTKLTALEYSSAAMFAGGPYGMLTSDVDPSTKKSATAKAG